jgi:hypothetical protein
VDDLILCGNDQTEIDSVKKFLHDAFKIKDLGDLKYFLVLKIARNKSGISICQRKYTLELISSAGLLTAKPAKTPMVKGSIKCTDNEPDYEDKAAYQRLIGQLLYLTTT